MQDSARLLHKPNESCVQAREEAAHLCHQGSYAEVWPEYGLLKLIEQDSSDISMRLRHCEIDGPHRGTNAMAAMEQGPSPATTKR